MWACFYDTCTNVTKCCCHTSEPTTSCSIYWAGSHTSCSEHFWLICSCMHSSWFHSRVKTPHVNVPTFFLLESPALVIGQRKRYKVCVCVCAWKRVIYSNQLVYFCNVCLSLILWNVHLFMTEFDHPEVTVQLTGH